MAGREKKGIDFISSTVFKGANYILTPVARNKEENLKMIEDLVYKLGFKRVRRITHEHHDEMIGYSYRDLTRIANINEDLWSELFLGNKENLLTSIENFEVELDKIKHAIENDDKEALKELFIKSTKRREKL
jgi:prephenate dehydrogenase